jgi:hypothetical protein
VLKKVGAVAAMGVGLALYLWERASRRGREESG